MDTLISSRRCPIIWKSFERTIEGNVKKFWVQDLPEEHTELAISYFTDYFIRDEPLSRALKIRECENSVNEMRDLWRDIVSQKCTLACYTEVNNKEKKLAALNFCTRNSMSCDKIQVKSERVKKLFEFFDYVSNLKNIYQTFDVDEYLGAMGLITLPEYRGNNLGLELLHSRRYLCENLGLKISVTVFTGPASQRLAEKAGFKDVIPISLDEMEKKHPSLIIPNLRSFTDKFRLMYILYE